MKIFKYLLIPAIAILTGFESFLGWSLIQEIFIKTISFFGDHHDFLAFYSAAHFILIGLSNEIFNAQVISSYEYSLIHKSVGALGYMPFLNPPFYAAFLTPLALFNLSTARLVWFFTSLFLAVLAIYIVTKPIKQKSKLLIIPLLTLTFPMYQALVEGQSSIIMLVCSSAAIYLAQNKKLFLSGLFLSALFIKPQLIMLLLLILMIYKQWKLLMGILTGIISCILVSLPFTGIQIYLKYPKQLFGIFMSHINGADTLTPSIWAGSLNLTEGINGLFIAILGQTQVTLTNILTLSLITIFLILTAVAIKKSKTGLKSSASQQFIISLITTTLLIDPHLFAQDVILLYLVLPFLYKIFSKPFLISMLFIIFVNIIIIDQNFPVHIFTLTLIILNILLLLSIIFNKSSDWLNPKFLQYIFKSIKIFL